MSRPIYAGRASSLPDAHLALFAKWRFRQIGCGFVTSRQHHTFPATIWVAHRVRASVRIATVLVRPRIACDDLCDWYTPCELFCGSHGRCEALCVPHIPREVLRGPQV